ncbi:MAG: hypothetical protein ACP5IE_08225 [Infirmifilum sp.]
MGSLVKELGVDNAVLKVNCEGCEYEVFNVKPEIAKRFRQILKG